MFRMINITRLNPSIILRMLYTKMSVKESNMTQNNKKKPTSDQYQLGISISISISILTNLGRLLNCFANPWYFEWCG